MKEVLFYPCEEFSSNLSEDGSDTTDPDLLTGPESWWGDPAP